VRCQGAAVCCSGPANSRLRAASQQPGALGSADADCSPAPGGIHASLSTLALLLGLCHVILPWSLALLALCDLKDVVFSVAQLHRGQQGLLPMAGGTGLIEKGARGRSTRLKPCFLLAGTLTAVFISLPEAQVQRWPSPEALPCAVPQAQLCSDATTHHGVWECGLPKGGKGGTQLRTAPPEPPSSTSKRRLGISAGNPSFSWENVKV